jgi:diguanylate cyclase (GGDEF)-like protein/PAS domain S-box-containing protein
MLKITEQRRKIGLLVGALPKDQPFFSGVVAAARAYDARLFCIVGKNLRWPSNFDYQGNALYDLVDVKRLDGLITWAGEGVALGQLASREEMQAFFARYAPLPIVNYEKQVAGLHCVRTDTSASMKEVLRHLLGVHHRRRVLLLRGPLHHYETEERIQAYRETLAEFGLPFQPQLVFPPFLWAGEKEEVFIRYLDESGLVPGRDFDAIAGTENYLACAAIRVLKARGFRVPETVAVVGYNESPENLATHPPLTTVIKPFFASGYRAFEVLLDVIDGKEPPPETLVPAELLLRSSCGCISQAILEVSASVEPGAAAVEIGEGLAGHLRLAAGGLVRRLPGDWIEHLWGAFQSDLRGEGRLEFVNTLAELMFLAAGESVNSLPWHQMLSRFRAGILPRLAQADLTAAETLWQQGRICIQEFFQQELFRQSVFEDQHNHILNQFAISLNSSINLQTMQEVIVSVLPRVGIPTCYLSLYADPAWPSGAAQLVLAYRDGQRLPLPPEGVLFPACELVPEDLLPGGRGYAMVVEPLYFQERQLGFIVTEYTSGDERLFESLQMQISSALDRLLIEQDVRESEERYHTLVDNLRELILVHRGGELLFANQAARQYIQSANPGGSLLDLILQESRRAVELGKSAGAEGNDYEIDVQGGDGAGRRMIVRTQEVFYNHAPAEQIILFDITERKRLEDHLYFMSTRDALTGLYNRAFFEGEMTRLQSRQRPVSIIVMDVNDLKRVNDRQGHAAGDELLRLAARALRSAFRGEDTISRIGGDEFAVILPQMDEYGVVKSIERVQRHLDEINREQLDFNVSLAIGGATALEGENLFDSFKQADLAMYLEKALKKASQL